MVMLPHVRTITKIIAMPACGQHHEFPCIRPKQKTTHSGVSLGACVCITSACAYALRFHDKAYFRHNEVVVVSSYNLVDVVIRIELLRSA